MLCGVGVLCVAVVVAVGRFGAVPGLFVAVVFGV